MCGGWNGGFTFVVNRLDRAFIKVSTLIFKHFSDIFQFTSGGKFLPWITVSSLENCFYGYNFYESFAVYLLVNTLKIGKLNWIFSTVPYAIANLFSVTEYFQWNLPSLVATRSSTSPSYQWGGKWIKRKTSATDDLTRREKEWWMKSFILGCWKLKFFN